MSTASNPTITMIDTPGMSAKCLNDSENTSVLNIGRGICHNPNNIPNMIVSNPVTNTLDLYRLYAKSIITLPP